MKKILIVGSGYMAQEYANVLSAMPYDFEILGNRRNRIDEVKQKYPNIKCHSGGYQSYLNENKPPLFVIIAVSVDVLYSAAISFITAGTPNILIEKPAGLSSKEISHIAELCKIFNTRLFVAYNRRFYHSINLAKEIIENDEGVLSLNFEFTEWAHTIDQQKFPQNVLERFIIANSSHVIDTVFYLIGKPETISCIVHGNDIEWHKSGSIFCGSGISTKNIPFSYHSNWGSAGRWGIEILTSNHRLYLRPMERLHIQKKGTITTEEIESDYELDTVFKPGLFLQTQAFLSPSESNSLCSIEEHLSNFYFYEQIGGYNK